MCSMSRQTVYAFMALLFLPSFSGATIVPRGTESRIKLPTGAKLDQVAFDPPQNRDALSLPNLAGRQSSRRPLLVKGKAGSFQLFLQSSIPEDALATVLSAVKVWSDSYPCDVPIRIALSWEELPGVVLGRTAQRQRFTKTDEKRPELKRMRSETVYPAVVAAALTGEDFVPPDQPHIEISFNSKVPWHLDVKTYAPPDKFDLATAALHEMGHGVGFLGEITQIGNAPAATYGNKWKLPGRFDRFLEVGEGRDGLGVTEKCSLTTGELYRSVTSQELRFAGFGLSSPPRYRGGSQTYHLSEDTLQRDCERQGIAEEDCSDLMTPQVGRGYTQRKLGQPTIRILNHILSKEAGFMDRKC